MNKPAGIVAMGGFHPGKEIPQEELFGLIDYLRNHTNLHSEYINATEATGAHPGTIEDNYQGWESQPWFEAWLERLPGKKKEDPFQGTEVRSRVPMDPESLKKSIHPHPMLSSDAEAFAGAVALYQSGINTDEVDLVLVSSLVPDRHVPLNASLVQDKLKLKNAGAYNVDTCCSSFITMLEMASLYVKSGMKKNVLIVASSLDSMINDKSTYWSVDTGDAAVAALVSETSEGFDFISSHSFSNGNRHEAIIFQNRSPYLHQQTSQGPSYEQEFVTFYNGDLCKEIGANAQKDMVHVVEQCLEKQGLNKDDIDFLVLHQPVAWASHAWRDAIGVSKEKHYESFKRYANIACASAPTNLLEAVEKGLIKAGDKVLIASSGVGENHISVMFSASPEFIRNNCVLCNKTDENQPFEEPIYSVN
jgi:3-oxoacyl-[acyl-carrier-protein] synthase III